MTDLDLELDDLVILEVPSFEDVVAFTARLRPRWDGWSHADQDGWLLTAQLTADHDLAALLREAQDLLAERAIPAIRVFVDGRVYALEAARVPVAP